MSANEWKLVPVEPTIDMSVAFAEVFYSGSRAIDDDDIRDWWSAMLAAAPTAPAQAASGGEVVAWRKRGEDGEYMWHLWKAEPLVSLGWEPLCIATRASAPPAGEPDRATPSGGREAGPEEDRIEAAYWRFDARHQGYGEWKQAPMSERDAFKAEMRNALAAEKTRAEMRLVARGWRKPEPPAGDPPAPAAAREVVEALRDYAEAAHYFVEAHDNELREAGETRESVRTRMLNAEQDLIRLGYEFGKRAALAAADAQRAQEGGR